MKYLYDTDQRLTGTTVINLKDSLVYNSFREVKEYHARSTTDSLYRCLYKRDKLGRIIEKTKTVQGTMHKYGYTFDMAGRLTEVRTDDVLTSTYSYDANGNRLLKVSTAGTDSGKYDAQDRLLSYGSDSYVYGRNGEVQRKYSGISFTDYNYDVFGNLLSVSLANGTTIEYIVDGQNRRIGKKVNGVLVQGLLYQNQINPVAELDANNKVVSRFVYGSKGNVPDQIFKGDSLTYRVITDQVGSVRMVVNAATGVVAQRMDYDEFGNVIYDSNPGFQPFGFAGGLYEPLTQLVRFGARDYQASSGRWLSKDPIGFDGGMNQYEYIENDPINYIDPSGLVPRDMVPEKAINNVKDIVNQVTNNTIPGKDLNTLVDVMISEVSVWDLGKALDLAQIASKLPINISEKQEKFINKLFDKALNDNKSSKNIVDIINKAKSEFEKAKSKGSCIVK